MAALSKDATLVFVALSMHANHTDQSAFPSASRLQQLCGITNRSKIFKALRELESMRIVQVIRSDGGAYKPNLYVFNDSWAWQKVADIPIRIWGVVPTVIHSTRKQSQNDTSNSDQGETLNQLTI